MIAFLLYSRLHLHQISIKILLIIKNASFRLLIGKIVIWLVYDFIMNSLVLCRLK
jgi:hypothetical protein